MNTWVDRRSGSWASLSVAAGILAFTALEIYETPTLTPLELLLEAVELVPIVLLSVGFVLLFRMALRQRDDQLAVIRDLEVARVEGQRWRSEVRTLLNGLGEAIDQQFSRWNLTEAEREVALLLLKGLSVEEAAQVRANQRAHHPRAGAIAVCEGGRLGPGGVIGVLPGGPAGANREREVSGGA